MSNVYLLLTDIACVAITFGIMWLMDSTSRYEGFPTMLNTGRGAEGCLLILLATPFMFTAFGLTIYLLFQMGWWAWALIGAVVVAMFAWAIYSDYYRKTPTN